MKIAWSCAGEGFGHAARLAALHGALGERHDITLFLPSTVDSFVRERLPHSRSRVLPCFLFVKEGNRVRYLETAAAALKNLACFIPAVRRLSRELRSLGVEAVISDFEPYLPWAARLAGIPVLQLNHPGIIGRFPSMDPRSIAARFAARLVQGPWDRRILISFYGGDAGPLLRPSLVARGIADEGYLAVNIKEEIRGEVLPLLAAIPGLKWKLYPSAGSDFDEGLARCSAVLTSAGHQTLSEALVLGKPVLAFPQKGQWEQILNAKMLERTGRGLSCRFEGLGEALPRFLSNLEVYRAFRIQPSVFTLEDSREDLIGKIEEVLREFSCSRSFQSLLSSLFDGDEREAG